MFNPFITGGKSTLVQEETEEEPLIIPSPYKIKQKLDEHVVGQEEAKIILSVAANTHYKRVVQEQSDSYKDVEIQKSNVLLVGESGCGKTLLVQTLANILDVPFIAVDATDFTPTGIVGKNVNDIVKDLKIKANDNEKKASMGIVFIDEFDKISSNKNANQVVNRNGIMSGEIQSCFLKLLEGKESMSVERGLFGSSSSTFNTSNILFICGGAFSGIENIIEAENDVVESRIGFYSDSIVKKERVVSSKVEPQHLISYGLMPEIVGRIPIIAQLNSLGKDDLLKILTEPKNSLVKQYKKLFDMDGVALEFEQEALEEVVNKVTLFQTGARGLRTVLEPVITRAIYALSMDEKEDLWKCVITKESIADGKEPLLISRKNAIRKLISKK